MDSFRKTPDFERASWLTPFRAGDGWICGAAYSSSGQLVPGSLRDGTNAAYQHDDPQWLTEPADWQEISEQPLLYLGHGFDFYGHFLLESLPMFSFLLDDFCDQHKGAFLMWEPSTGSLIRAFAKLLGLEDQLVDLPRAKTCRGSFLIAPRPISINTANLDPLPYRRVIASAVSRIALIHPELATAKRNIFLRRESNRVPEAFSRRVENVLADSGFDCIDTRHMSIAEQIATLRGAKVIAGFEGSQLHNTIFADSESLTISLGDSRNPRGSQPNQIACATISGGGLVPVPYLADKPDTVAEEVLRLTMTQPRASITVPPAGQRG